MYEFSLWKGKRKKENVTVSSPGRKHSPKLPVQNKDADVERKVASSSSSVSKVLGNMLGSGTFGKVFKALNMRTGSLFAVKKLVLDGAPQSQVAALQREISVLQKLKHENIVRYLGTERAKRVLCIFLEYVPGGSVSSMLSEFGAFPESLIRRYTKQILRGVWYLHSRNIVHRDIKGANVRVVHHYSLTSTH